MSICTPGVCSVTCLQTYSNFITSSSNATNAALSTCGHPPVSLSKHRASLNIPQDALFHRAVSQLTTLCGYEAEMSVTGADGERLEVGAEILITD